MLTKRVMGKSIFAHIQDGSARFQIYVKKDVVGDTAFQAFEILDLGDQIGAEGELFVTKTGEKSLKVMSWTLLCKALLPWPEKWHGLHDVELRYRYSASLLLLGLIVLLMLPIAAGVGGLLWILNRWRSRSLNAANQLLRDCAPQAARLTPIERASRDGVLAIVCPLAGQPAEPVHALINPSFRWSPPPRREIEVRVYCWNLAPGHELVALQPDGVPLLGKVVDRTAYNRQQRMLRVAALVLLGAALVGIWVFGGVPGSCWDWSRSETF